MCEKKLIEKKLIRQILHDILNSQGKEEDAPCSAESHLYRAINYLYKLVPDYTTMFREDMELIWEAQEFMAISYGIATAL